MAVSGTLKSSARQRSGAPTSSPAKSPDSSRVVSRTGRSYSLGRLHSAPLICASMSLRLTIWILITILAQSALGHSDSPFRTGGSTKQSPDRSLLIGIVGCAEGTHGKVWAELLASPQGKRF